MIIPDTIGKSEFTNKLVNFIEEQYYLYQIDFFPNLYVFQNVGVRSKILSIKKKKDKNTAIKIKHFPHLSDTIYLTNSKIKGNEQYLLNIAKFKINITDCLILGDLCYVSYGMRLNSDKPDPKKFKKTDLISELKDDLHPKLYTEGKYLERYNITLNQYLEYGTERCPIRLVRPTFPELYPPRKLLLSRQKKLAVISNEGHCCDNTIIMAIPRYELSDVKNNSIKKYYKNIGKDRKIIEENSKFFELSYLLSIINSKLLSYFMNFESKGKIDYYPDDWKNIPIKKISLVNQQPFIKKADKMLSLNKELQEINQKFQRTIQRIFFSNDMSTSMNRRVGSIANDTTVNNNGVSSIAIEKKEKLSKKLQKWFLLNYSDFIKELKKKKIKLSLSEEAEWEDYFLQEQQKALALKTKIDTTDKEIDAMVYKLYGLTEEEISIVENS